MLTSHSLDGIFHEGYIHAISWDVEYTDEFGDWWSGLSEPEQESLAASVQLLEERGPEMSAGTTSMCQWQIDSTTSIWNNFERKG